MTKLNKTMVVVLCVMTPLFMCLALSLSYCWWRSGQIVLSQAFDGFIIQVRRVPHVSEGAFLSSPPGVADDSFVIEVGGNNPRTTLRLPPSSERFLPTSIIRIGNVNDRTFQIQFSNGQHINVRMANGQVSLAEWFR